MRKIITNLLLIFVFLIGLSLLLYPVVSDYWNYFHQSRAMTSYSEVVSNIDDEEYKACWDDAVAFNEELRTWKNRWKLDEEQQERYYNTLHIAGSDVMGYINIPSINVTLPIYHGTSEPVLQVAVGHIEGSSLPVGGEGTHCVLSGHRGLPSARLFTDLDKVTEGDIFTLKVLEETLTYEVDQILIVEPDDITALDIEEGKDYCTLVTCTPYGINSHRILVRGHRIANEAAASPVHVTADAVQYDPMLTAAVAAAPVVVILLLCYFIKSKKSKKGKKGNGKESEK